MNIITSTFSNIIRYPFLSGAIILVSAIMLYFINILFLISATNNYISNVITEKLSISIHLKEWMWVRDIKVIDLIKDLKDANKNIEIEYVSPTSAFEKLQKRAPNLVSVINLNNNPLPTSLIIRNIKSDNYWLINKIVSDHRSVLKYNEKSSNKTWKYDYISQYSKIQKAIKSLTSISKWIYISIVFFSVALFIVLYISISQIIFFLKREIEIVILVWGKARYLYLPFILQVIIYSLLSTLISIPIFIYSIDFIAILLPDITLIFNTYFLSWNINIFKIELIWIIWISILSWISATFITKKIITKRK